LGSDGVAAGGGGGGGDGEGGGGRRAPPRRHCWSEWWCLGDVLRLISETVTGNLWCNPSVILK